MSLQHNLISFSDNGEYLAYSSPDGCLKIWESSTGVLKQEYTPSSHLSATCSSLKWGPSANKHRMPKKLKRGKCTLLAIKNLQLIAMGTMTGDILLYSFTNADLHTCLSNGHTSRVNDVIWYSDSLYTCSNDYCIIIWDICSGTIKNKWKTNTGAVHSLCVIDDNNIFSASNTIQWWDVNQKTIKKTFNGHATEVFKLLPLTFRGNNYLLSAAVGDRVINMWELTKKSSSRAIVSFVLSDEPTYIDILIQENEPFRMSSVSKDGTFHFFEHILNGDSKKPIQPNFTVQIALKPSDGQKPGTISILAANISNGLDFCLLTYGSFLKPAFERIDISNNIQDLFLIRNLSVFSSAPEDITKIKQTEKPSDVKLLAPGHMIDVRLSENTSRKRKKINVNIEELPMEERLKALDLSKTPKEISEEESTVKSDSMVHLLLQSLQSKDNSMLYTLLICNDESVIHNTIQRLPIQSILPFLKVLYERLSKRENRKTHPCLKWFTALITIHLPYFMSNPDIGDYLIPFNQLITARKEVICKLSQAHGILKMLMIQAANISSNVIETQSKPLLEYQSESSSEESEIEMKQSDEETDNEIAQDSSSLSTNSSDSESDMGD